MEQKISFGKFIMKKRKEKNMTQKELAQKLFVTESAVSKWERGLSYPDISLITSICEALDITERELLTSSEDVAQRNRDRLAWKYQRMTRRYHMIMISCYAGALAVCLIANMAVAHRLDWFFIVLAGVLVAFSVTSLPGLLKTHKGEGTLGAFYGSLLFLLAVCNGFTHAHWFGIAALSISFGLFAFFAPPLMKVLPWPAYMASKKALIWLGGMTGFTFALTCAGNRIAAYPLSYGSQIAPLLAFEFAFVWLLFLWLRYPKLNKWLKAAGSAALCAPWILLQQGMLDTLLEGMPLQIVRWDLRQWGNPDYLNGNIIFLIAMCALAAAVVFLLLGTIRGIARKKGLGSTY